MNTPMNILTKLFGSGAKEVVTSVGTVLDKLITNKEERIKAQLEVEKEVNRHFEALETNSLKQIELEIQDRSSARVREVDLAKTGRWDFLMYLTGLIILSAFGAIVYASIWMKVEGEHFVRISTMVETLTVGISGYYFGSSKGSHDKNKALLK